MAAFSLRNDLQRDIFTPQNERLLAVSSVWKASRKRKEAILCAAVSLDSWGKVSLVTVKGLKGNYKLSSCWSATELSLVDGKDAVKETAEFHLHLDKVYQWETNSPVEKRAFITCLWKINQRYLQDRVKFVNITPDILDEVLPWQHCRVSEEQEEEEEGFQELTAREAASVEQLMEESELAMSDAEAFTQVLHVTMANMDQENMQAMMTSELQAEQLLILLDQAVEELGHIEEVLTKHDLLLQSVQKKMENLYRHGALLQHVDHNHRQMCTELCHLVDGLTLSEDHVRVLTKGDLDNKEHVKACTRAVTALSKCNKTPLTAGQRRLQGVAEQLIRFENVRQIFEQRLTQHIINAVMQQGLVKEPQREGETLLKTENFHRQLLEYTPLMSWLRQSSPQVFQRLTQVYAENIGKLFDKQMKDFFHAARLQLLGVKETQKSGAVPCATRDSSSGLVPLRCDRRASGVVQQVLTQLESVCVMEQQFLTVFFSLDSGPKIAESLQFPDGRRGSAVDQAQNCVELKQRMRPHSWGRFSAAGAPPEPGFGEQDCVRAVLGPVETRLWSVLSLCEEVEPLSFLSTLKVARLCLTHQQHNPAASFCCSLLQGALQLGQCSLRRYTESLCKEMESVRALKKARPGILPTVLRLEEFVKEGQTVLGGSEQCWGLDKAYIQLFSTAFHTLDSLSGQSTRCSPLVVKLLNFHRLAGFLGRVGLPKLGPLWEEAKERMAFQVQEYVRAHLGQPFGRLSDFLDGVRRCLAHGVREEEVCFQLAYSKQELRRLTALHSGQEVQRTLEVLHKKTGRELSEAPALLQVVWTAIQQDLEAQYRRFESIVGRCYPGVGVSLESSRQDVQEFFRALNKNAKPGS
ncbi:exocyst complex component 1-like [Conger conger]|uniref:exocyst complex component 1-like n=1 Tax=Conger conger TaxID=82655 RepID=UPI002A5AB1CF|nr:exocyst complex component 1-like [Conger conger]